MHSCIGEKNPNYNTKRNLNVQGLWPINIQDDKIDGFSFYFNMLKNM